MAVRSGKVPLRPIEFSLLTLIQAEIFSCDLRHGNFSEADLCLILLELNQNAIKSQLRPMPSLLDCNRDDDARQDQSQ
jgi:hypothetical protein